MIDIVIHMLDNAIHMLNNAIHMLNNAIHMLDNQMYMLVSEKSKKAYQTMRLVMHLYEVIIRSGSKCQYIISEYICLVSRYQFFVCIIMM